MIHSIYIADQFCEVSIDETKGSNTTISIQCTETMEVQSVYLSKEQLKDFIGALLHVQSKKRRNV